MLACVQTFGLAAPYGGARILRALVSDAPCPILSISSRKSTDSNDLGFDEVLLPLRPSFGRFERRPIVPVLHTAELCLGPRFAASLTTLVRKRGVSCVHALAHGSDFWWAFLAARDTHIPYVLSVHDDLAYTLAGRLDSTLWLRRLGHAWRGANLRFVISTQLGEEYCRRYGTRSFTVVTDGIATLPRQPMQRDGSSLRVYFMGLLHLGYHSNFSTLVDALELIHASGVQDVRLTCRTGDLSAFGWAECIRNLPFGSEDQVIADMKVADVLYLPLPFGDKYDLFRRYSVSTKMVTYLSSGLPILYHGPRDALAAQMLHGRQAAIISDHLRPQELARVLSDRSARSNVAQAALGFAADSFMLSDQRRHFWDKLSPLISK
jgi:glycosyltransferase involved in cell wall biosynthesis